MDASAKLELVCRRDGSVQEDLQRHVYLRTGRRIRNLSVELRPNGVVLRGLAHSYYIKQLAQQSVLDVLPHVRLQNSIDVGPQD